MTKTNFQNWALKKYPTEFKHDRGILYWFWFPFWKLNIDSTRWIIQEFKNEMKQK